MRRIAAIMVSLAVLGYGSLMAAEAPAAADAQAGKEKTLEKLGVMKGRLMAKSQAIATLLDQQAQGINDVYPAVQKIYGQVNAAIGKQLQEENAKPQEMRNVTLIDNLNKKSQKCGEMWTEFSNQWGIYSAKRGIVSSLYNTTYGSIFNPIRNMDEACLATGVDMELLVPLFAAVDKRWEELKTELAALNDTMKKNVATWEMFAKE